jgi:signal transduction histidine kinase
MIRITVEDHGIGISKKARKSLFAPYKQAQRMAGGTGLGLYSLLKRIEALGGEVKIDILDVEYIYICKKKVFFF